MDKTPDGCGSRNAAGPDGHTLWHQFLEAGSVHLMRAAFDENRCRLHVTHQLMPRDGVAYAHGRAPWLDEEETEAPVPK